MTQAIGEPDGGPDREMWPWDPPTHTHLCTPCTLTTHTAQNELLWEPIACFRWATSPFYLFPHVLNSVSTDFLCWQICSPFWGWLCVEVTWNTKHQGVRRGSCLMLLSLLIQHQSGRDKSTSETRSCSLYLHQCQTKMFSILIAIIIITTMIIIYATKLVKLVKRTKCKCKIKVLYLHVRHFISWRFTFYLTLHVLCAKEKKERKKIFIKSPFWGFQ